MWRCFPPVPCQFNYSFERTLNPCPKIACNSSVKKWGLLRNRNRRLLDPVGHDLRFGWHGYLWYDKVKMNVDFKKLL